MNIVERKKIRTREQVAVIHPEHGLNCRYLRSITDEPQNRKVNRNLGLRFNKKWRKVGFEIGNNI